MSQNQERTCGFSPSDGKNGFRIDHRSETETRWQTRETRNVDGGGREVHRQERQVVNLEELKSRETSRIATAEDVRALLEAEFEGIREIQTSREISVEEFNLIESEFKKRLGAKAEAETTIREEHRLENVLESPQWKARFGVPLSTRNEIVDVREATVVERNYLEPQLTRVTAGNLSLQRAGSRASGAADEGVAAGGTTVRSDYQDGSLRHEARQKRHVIEEVFVEDSDKFYENTTPKKPKKVGEAAEPVFDGERNKHLTMTMAAEEVEEKKARKKKTGQNELIVEDANLFKDDSGRSTDDYKIKPMYSGKAKLVAGQDVDKYFVTAEGDKENAANRGRPFYSTTSSSSAAAVAATTSSSSSGAQQEIVIGEVKTYREGTLDVDKNRSVEKINSESGAGKSSRLFKKRLNQKDIKLLPKLRHKQEEIVINDPTVYDEAQFMSLRKAEKKKKRLLENSKTLPAKFGKKSKAQLDREVEMILKRSEEIAEGKHQGGVAAVDAPAQVVLEEPEVFRETSVSKKKQIPVASGSSLEKRRLEKLERESRESSRGPQEEMVIDDPEVFRETTLTRKKKKTTMVMSSNDGNDAGKKEKSSKILNDIMRDMDVLTQEARRGGGGDPAEPSAAQQAELVLLEGTKEAKVMTGETQIVDETAAVAADQRKSGGGGSHHQHQSEIVVDDETLFADHNKPKDIHLEHGRAVQIAEMDDFDLPELESKEAVIAAPQQSEQQKSNSSNIKNKKKFQFKKKKKFQGESVVDESFVYEDAAKIRLNETPKKPDAKAGAAAASSSNKTFWNWNFGQSKGQQQQQQQQEVIKDESHYHEDKQETTGDQATEQELAASPRSVETSEEIRIEPPVSFQDVDASREQRPEMKLSDGPEPDVVRVETVQSFLGVTVKEGKIHEEEEEEKMEAEGLEVGVGGAKEKGNEKSKFKIHMPSFTIPKPHLNFGFKKQQQQQKQQENLALEDKSIVVESLEVKMEQENVPAGGGGGGGGDGNAGAGSSFKEVVRDQETVVVEENQNTEREELTQAEVKEVKQVKAESQKSKFHLPSFTVPRPHINFGFKKHQKEVVAVVPAAEEDKKEVVVLAKPEDLKEEKVESNVEGANVVLAKEKAIYQEDVFVEEIHKAPSKVEVEVTGSGGPEAAEQDQEGQNERSVTEKVEVVDGKVEEEEATHDSKFKVHLPHIPKPHLNIHFTKHKEEEGETEDDKKKDKKKDEEKEQVEQEEESDKTAEVAKKEKFKFTVPHINLHVPHIHFTSIHGKQEEVVVDDKSIIPDAAKVLVAEENVRPQDATLAADVEIKEDPTAVKEATEESIKDLPELIEVVDKSDETVVVVEEAKKQTEEIVETGTTETFKEEAVKEVSTLDGKGKKKSKFSFPHFSLPRSHGKQSESVAGDAVIVEDSTKLKMTERKLEVDEASEETSVDKSEELEKDKKAEQQQHKFKLRFPKPNFKFGFKSKDKHKPDISQESKEIETSAEEKKLEVSAKEEEKEKEEEEGKTKKEEEKVQAEISAPPCAEEYTETANYVLEAGEEVPAAPTAIKVDPDEYKMVIGKSKPTREEIRVVVQDAEVTEVVVDSSEMVDSKIDESPETVEAKSDVPYYEYEPNGKEGSEATAAAAAVAAAVVVVAAATEEVDLDKSQTVVVETSPTAEQEAKDEEAKIETEPEAKPVKEEAKDEEAKIETKPEAKPVKEEAAHKSKSKFHFPCIKTNKSKHADQELSSDDEPAYGEVEADEQKDPSRQQEEEKEKKDEEEKEEEGAKHEEGKEPEVEGAKTEGTEKSDKPAKKKHKKFNMKSLGRKPHQGEVVVNDAHIYTDNSTLGRRFLNKFRHKVAPESTTFILENNLPESSVGRQKALEEPIVPGARPAPLEAEVGDEASKHKKQDELIVGGASVVTEARTSKHHKQQQAKAAEQAVTTTTAAATAASSQELPDSERTARKKDHGKLTSLFHRTSGEYDLEHQKRTNQPLVELISSRPKQNGETESAIASSSSAAMEESSWSMSCRKNLTLDASNHLTFETEYVPDESKSTENVQLFCPSTRRSYRKQIQIDDLDLIKTFEATGSQSRDKGPIDASTPVKAAAPIKPDPIKWASSVAKNTSYFSTLPDFETVDDRQRSPHFVVVAIDFGTTFSGYAFSFRNDVDGIHVMRKWEGGDPGVVNQKTPTTLLLTPDGEFHSFGFTARDFYHDLSPKEAKRWLYFEKFKMALHYSADLSSETEIPAANGVSFRAQEVFAHALRFFKNHALLEIGEQTGTELVEDDVKWVITVPAIWKAPAKQFMRQAAYKAGIASEAKPDQLVIALEPEAASVFVRKQRLRQLIPEEIDDLKDARRSRSSQDVSGAEASSPVLLDTIPYQTHLDESSSWSQSVASNALSMSFQRCPSPTSFPVAVGHEVDITDNRFMVADCGGGTVDITVYEMLSVTGGKLKELHKASGGPYGSMGVDLEFEKMLVSIFERDFIETFKVKRPAGWVDLMMAFESRKRAANPFKTKPLNVSLPFSFIDYYRKFKNATVESAIRKYSHKEVKWSSQGMMRLMPECMNSLFQPTLDAITGAITDVLRQPDVSGVKHIFLVGGFAESPMLQQEIRKNFAHQARILIPTDVSLTILKGAVLYGIDPSIVVIRKSRLTYGLGVLNRFVEGKHPDSKRAMKDGAPWCVDVFDHLVLADQSVALGSSVIRSYTPAEQRQKFSLFHIYCTESREVDYVTDEGVVKCGTLRLDLDDHQWELESNPSRPVSQQLEAGRDLETTLSEEGAATKGRREIQARLTFGDTEIKIIALDVATGNYVRATLDFLNK